MKRILIIAFVFSFSALAQYTTPTKKYTGELNFWDDINFENIDLAIKRQLRVYKGKYDINKTITFGKKTVKIKRLKDTLLKFQEIVNEYRECTTSTLKKTCIEYFNQKMHATFDIYTPNVREGDPRHGDAKPALYTTYYSPDFIGSYVKTSEYTNAIHAKPKDPKLRASTRVQIDFDGVLKDKGLELFYVKESLYDKYLLHIEGGGRVKVAQKDGSYRKYYLSYDGSNKQSFRFIHKYMKERGYLTNNLSIAAQRKFLADNPDKAREIFEYCPSYIYFKVTEDEPVGIDNIPLTEKRSMALDRKLYRVSGLLGFVSSKMPQQVAGADSLGPESIPTKDFSRFFVHQDTGGAIKGKARADLYAGFGAEAEFLANFFKYQGTMHFLLLKD